MSGKSLVKSKTNKTNEKERIYMAKSVVLDYGHGSNTWENGGGKGVRKNNKVYEEHDFNSDVGTRVKKILEAHGVKVYESQPAGGYDRSLTSRTNLYFKVNADMLISFHANAGVASASGACVFAWKGASNSNRMADLVVKHMKAQGIDLHGNGRHNSYYNSWTNFHITRETAEANKPAILIEHGFMTNSRDFENIFGKNANSYRQKCAVADAKAILEYLGIAYKSNTAEKAYKPTEEDYNKGRIGRVTITTPSLNFRKDKSLNAGIIKTLKEGQSFYVYAKDGKWYNLGGGWASAGSDGSLMDVDMFPAKPKPKPQPKEPKKTVYRVIVNGEQVGAYSEDSNVLAQIKSAMGHLKDDIKIEKV
jgi:N-acetylmuramoyl-L-alanine amidase